jgi:hypothetical protein
MSTINVDVVSPQSGDNVEVNGIVLRKENNSNIGLGSIDTLSSITSGDGNIGLGVNAVKSVAAGFSNIGIGTDTLENCTGNQNIAIGSGALQYVVGANNNTAIGNTAGQILTTGNNNVLLGNDAADSLTTGSNNIVIGWLSEATTPTTDNSITLGTSYHNVLRCAVTSITSLSDARDKKEIEILPIGLDFINSLKPVSFVWDERDEKGKHDIKDFGFIAQDLKKSQEDAKLAETLKLVYEENPEKLEASYGKLIPILVKAIQDLSAKVTELENKLK